MLLACSASTTHRERTFNRWRCVLYSVFGDESHDESSSRVFAVGGLFGSDEHWEELNGKWLERTGGTMFHATECDSDQGEFAGIDHADNKKLYKDLTQIICRSRIMGFGVAIDLAGHDQFFPDVPEDIPYYWCFNRVVFRCGEWARLSIPQGIVKFTFDQRQESNYNAGVLYNYMANLPEWKASPYLFEEISFASRKLVGIQAADLFTRETMKHLDNIVGPVVRRKRRSLEALQETQRFGWRFFTREYFEDFKRQFKEVSAKLGMDGQRYLDWLNEHKVDDSISARHRYLIGLDHA